MRHPGSYKRVLRFSVHHKHYRNVPNEGREDVMILCWQCHDICHLILRLEGIGGIYPLLADIVRKYFVYEKDTYF